MSARGRCCMCNECVSVSVSVSVSECACACDVCGLTLNPKPSV